MSIETNKEDFDGAMRLMVEAVEDKLNGIISDQLIEIFETVISEYRDHYEDDILRMIDDNERYDTENDTLLSTVNDLEEQLETSEAKVEELEEQIKSLEENEK